MQRLHIENSQADVLILHKDSDTYVDVLSGDGEWEEGRGGRHCGVQQTCHRNDSLLSLLVGINIPSIIQITLTANEFIWRQYLILVAWVVGLSSE